jgi:hypothetical protein
MIKRLIIVSALIAAMATPALAGQLGEPTIRAGHWDFSLQTRYTSSHDYDGPDGSSVSFNDDLGWGFGFGYNVNDRFSAGFLMSWRTVSYNATAVDATDATNTVNYSNWLDTGTIAATGTWNLLPKRFTPYVNGAIGWTMFDSNVASGIQTGCWYDPWWGYVPTRASQGMTGGSALRRGLGFLVVTLNTYISSRPSDGLAQPVVHKIYA